MQRTNDTLTLYEKIGFAERDWMTCGLLWIAIGTLAVGPVDVVARAGRVFFALALSVHMVEAVYVAFGARRAAFGAQKWFLRTMVLGSLALLKLEVHLRKGPRRRSVR